MPCFQSVVVLKRTFHLFTRTDLQLLPCPPGRHGYITDLSQLAPLSSPPCLESDRACLFCCPLKLQGWHLDAVDQELGYRSVAGHTDQVSAEERGPPIKPEPYAHPDEGDRRSERRAGDDLRGRVVAESNARPAHARTPGEEERRESEPSRPLAPSAGKVGPEGRLCGARSERRRSGRREPVPERQERGHARV